MTEMTKTRQIENLSGGKEEVSSRHHIRLIGTRDSLGLSLSGGMAMKRLVAATLALALVLGLAGAALANGPLPDGPPDWWGDADFQAGLTGTLENTGGGGDASGTLDVVIENLGDPHKRKELYAVFDWEVLADSGASALFAEPVPMEWSGPPGSTTLSPIVNYIESGVHHLEYSYGIAELWFPQPDQEILHFDWSGLDVTGDSLAFEYDIRTKCFPHDIIPEPAGLGLLGLGLLTLRKRRT